MIEEAERLMALLVKAYPGFVRARAPEGPDLTEAIEQGREWLAAELDTHLSRPFPEQRRGPLEIFQEAMRFPTEVLAGAGVPAPQRDDVVESALPGDLYDLAPASSQELGEEVWRAHLGWGAAKAKAITSSRRQEPGVSGS